MSPGEILGHTFGEIEGYDEIIIIKNILLELNCEHHIVTILGKSMWRTSRKTRGGNQQACVFGRCLCQMATD